MKKPARILIIAGSDSSGGAGIQGDIKTVTALGGYAMTAITALTAQNTTGVYGIHPIPPDFIRQQIELVTSDIGVDAVKTGMLHSEQVIEVVADCIRAMQPAFFVLDPVMVAKGGAALLEENALTALKRKLLPLATIITPNIPEAEYLTGSRIHSLNDMEQAAQRIAALGSANVLIKGGHGTDDVIHNVLWANGSAYYFETPRLKTLHTHGTGCAMASAIATFLAQGMAIEQAVKAAGDYVYQAILHAPGLGHGHGPLRFMH